MGSKGGKFFRYKAIHRVDLTDNPDMTIYAVARELLAQGVDPEDAVETRRKGNLSMLGIIGDCAKLTVTQSQHGNPSLQLARWKPFLPWTSSPETASDEKCDAEPMNGI